ncbi:ribose 5-phosphate isomerase a [Zalerion maritima]|uniref:Ribose-5-phosphate isomerase n=1 Tax=Zalerion maritima TaxID=339359 RepID=A0AAD5RKI2_9PEZI|nr:ribose 5-phosphate isomerase a [Zalerion maritima]
MATLVESAKKAAAAQAVHDHLDPSYTWVGIGSGSTVVYVVDAIAALPRNVTSKMTFIPTGDQSKLLIIAAGLRLGSIDLRPLDENGKVRPLDVAFDGADEVDDDLNLIKGGGACLWQEKFVAAAAKKFVCVADYRKISPRLCTKWKTIPIEVHPLTAADVLRELRHLGSSEPEIRQGTPNKAGPVVTDNGMWLIDAPFAPLLIPRDLSEESQGKGTDGSWEVTALAEKLKSLLGVVEVGLFYGMNGIQAQNAGLDRQGQKPVAAYFGMEDGRVRVQSPE